MGAKKSLKSIAQEIYKVGLPEAVSNLGFVFTGDGNVSQGAQEIFKIFPATYLKPDEFFQASTKGEKGFVATQLLYSDFTCKESGASIFHEKVGKTT